MAAGRGRREAEPVRGERALPLLLLPPLLYYNHSLSAPSRYFSHTNKPRTIRRAPATSSARAAVVVLPASETAPWDGHGDLVTAADYRPLGEYVRARAITPLETVLDQAIAKSARPSRAARKSDSAEAAARRTALEMRRGAVLARLAEIDTQKAQSRKRVPIYFG